MSTDALPRLQPDALATTSDLGSDVDVEIVVPVYNESAQLAASITSLRTFLDASFPFVTTITIADNASTDGTWAIATDLATTQPRVRALHLDQKGRGRALRAAWSTSTASVVAYMDVDLATGLEALLPLVAPLLSGHSDVAIGSRLASGAHVVRGTRREFISRGYNLLLRGTLRSTCTDAQCGFKALRRHVAVELLPLVKDEAWFFDTELLITAQRVGLRIHEVPVDWVDDIDSRVDVLATAAMDLRGVVRMLGPAARRRAMTHPTGSNAAVTSTEPPFRPDVEQRAPAKAHADAPEVFADELLRFAGVGVISTVAYAALFAVLEPILGGYPASALAIALCSVGNTAAHRGMAGSAHHGLIRRDRLLVSSALLGVSLAVTTGALAVTRAVGLTSLFPELCAMTAANAGAAVIRFGILRTWVFRPQFGTQVVALPSSGKATTPRPPTTDVTKAGTRP